MLNEWTTEFSIISPGTLVRVVCDLWSDEPDNRIITLYETIHLETFPAWDDFFGKTTDVKCGQHALVLKTVGRPYRINPSVEIPLGGWGVDVYQILIDKDIRNILRCQIQESTNEH
jgi:hypothetical protein